MNDTKNKLKIYLQPDLFFKKTKKQLCSNKQYTNEVKNNITKS